MQQYENTSSTSCVWDAFIRAGLPVEERMLFGIRSDEVVEILEANGWTVFYKGRHFIPSNKPIIILRDWKKNFSHTEYHESPETIMDYDPDSIGAIAVKV